MPPVECSEQLATDCKVEFVEGPADPEKPPICSNCAELMLESMMADGK